MAGSLPFVTTARCAECRVIVQFATRHLQSFPGNQAGTIVLPSLNYDAITDTPLQWKHVNNLKVGVTISNNSPD